MQYGMNWSKFSFYKHYRLTPPAMVSCPAFSPRCASRAFDHQRRHFAPGPRVTSVSSSGPGRCRNADQAARTSPPPSFPASLNSSATVPGQHGPCPSELNHASYASRNHFTRTQRFPEGSSGRYS